MINARKVREKGKGIPATYINKLNIWTGTAAQPAQDQGHSNMLLKFGKLPKNTMYQQHQHQHQHQHLQHQNQKYRSYHHHHHHHQHLNPRDRPPLPRSSPHSSSESSQQQFLLQRSMSVSAAGSENTQQMIKEILETIEKNRALQTRRFLEWRRRNTFKLLLAGGLLGGGLAGIGGYLFIHNSPHRLEQFIVSKASSAFSKALTFDARKSVYFGLPEINVPIPQTPDDFIKLSSVGTTHQHQHQHQHQQQQQHQSTCKGLHNLELWCKTFVEGVKELDSKWILTAKNTMREELVREALTLPNIQDRLAAINDILAPSFEKNEIIAQQIDRYMQEQGGFIHADILENYPPALAAESTFIKNRLLVAAITFFPSSINKLVLFLTDEIDIDDIMDYVISQQTAPQTFLPSQLQPPSPSQSESQPPLSSSLKQSLKIIRNALLLLKQNFDEVTQESIVEDKELVTQHILQTALTKTIQILSVISDPTKVVENEMTPYELYCNAIDEDLLAPLRRDARITERILRQVRNVFLALPAKLQARILLKAIRHPLARGDVSPDEQATIVKDMLSSGGVVAVKLGQVLAEDPKVPKTYRALLAGLRDDNEPMSVGAFWHNIPLTVRSQIDYLGRRLGTGSVKQVHVGKFKTKDRAVAVLRNFVEDEALASIAALESSEELRPVATRLGRLVFGEFNLFGEGEALEEFANTSIGKHQQFKVVGVLHHSPKCLVEAIAKGKTLADVLDDPAGDEKLKKKVKELLVQYHRAVFEAFVQDGFIHSDIHLGNAIVEEPDEDHDNQNSDSDAVIQNDHDIRFLLFDVGQMDKIGFVDTKAVLWVLAAVSSEDRRYTLKDTALDNLVKVCSLEKEQRARITDIGRSNSGIDTVIRKKKKKNPDGSINHSDSPSRLSEKDERKLMRKLIDEAFEDACSPFEDGTIPNQKQAFLLFLRACEKRGIMLPHATFSVAKMIDSMLSQCDTYNLTNVVEEQIEKFCRKHMSWFELRNIIYNILTMSKRRKPPTAVQEKPSI